MRWYLAGPGPSPIQSSRLGSKGIALSLFIHIFSHCSQRVTTRLGCKAQRFLSHLAGNSVFVQPVSPANSLIRNSLWNPLMLADLFQDHTLKNRFFYFSSVEEEPGVSHSFPTRSLQGMFCKLISHKDFLKESVAFSPWGKERVQCPYISISKTGHTNDSPHNEILLQTNLCLHFYTWQLQCPDTLAWSLCFQVKRGRLEQANPPPMTTFPSLSLLASMPQPSST